MHQHTARVVWSLGDGDFRSGKYSRVHRWEFDGGLTVPASTAPQILAPPLSSLDAVDPEEALVAAASSCHMLTFLYLAYKAGFSVESYVDDAVGEMDTNEAGKTFVARIRLRPAVRFVGDRAPSPDELAALHHKAHEECYIANSIVAQVTVES